MSMHANIILIVTLCELIGYKVLCMDNNDYYKVGTVLFTPSDLGKVLWKEDEMHLLMARKHLQELLPPTSLVQDQNQYTIKLLYDYFGKAYNTIKQESIDPELKDIMSIAFLDAVGGYFKTLVLPITRYSFYGGNLGQDDASKVFKLYDEVRNQLNTNGSGWRSPSRDLIKSICVNVIPLQSHPRRDTLFPCDKFAYLENTDLGLTVPLPSITWGPEGEYMFLPVKNQSLIPLNSNDSPDALVSYYNTARYCIEDNKLGDAKAFNNKFQTWLFKNVIPHLNDDKLYPPFRSVLKIINDSSLACDYTSLYRRPIKSKPTVSLRIGTDLKLPIDLSSKKMIFLVVILLLEIIWCVPAIFYLSIKKLRKHKVFKSSVMSHTVLTQTQSSALGTWPPTPPSAPSRSTPSWTPPSQLKPSHHSMTPPACPLPLSRSRQPLMHPSQPQMSCHSPSATSRQPSSPSRIPPLPQTRSQLNQPPPLSACPPPMAPLGPQPCPIQPPLMPRPSPTRPCVPPPSAKPSPISTCLPCPAKRSHMSTPPLPAFSRSPMSARLPAVTPPITIPMRPSKILGKTKSQVIDGKHSSPSSKKSVSRTGSVTCKCKDILILTKKSSKLVRDVAVEACPMVEDHSCQLDYETPIEDIKKFDQQCKLTESSNSSERERRQQSLLQMKKGIFRKGYKKIKDKKKQATNLFKGHDSDAQQSCSSDSQPLKTTQTVTLINHASIRDINTQLSIPSAISKGNQSIDKASKTTMVYSRNPDVKLSHTQTDANAKKRMLKVSSCKHPFEITIDSPENDVIRLDILSPKDLKPSKIPKKTKYRYDIDADVKHVKPKKPSPKTARRSSIPQPKRNRTLEDIEYKGATPKVDKMNTTL